MSSHPFTKAREGGTNSSNKESWKMGKQQTLHFSHLHPQSMEVLVSAFLRFHDNTGVYFFLYGRAGNIKMKSNSFFCLGNE